MHSWEDRVTACFVGGLALLLLIGALGLGRLVFFMDWTMRCAPGDTLIKNK